MVKWHSHSKHECVCLYKTEQSHHTNGRNIKEKKRPELPVEPSEMAKAKKGAESVLSSHSHWSERPDMQSVNKEGGRKSGGGEEEQIREE